MGKGRKEKDREKKWMENEEGKGSKGKEREREALQNRREPRFLPNFDFGGASSQPPAPIRAKFGTYVQAYGILFHARFHRDWRILLHNHT